jgi:hypothetical protein
VSKASIACGHSSEVVGCLLRAGVMALAYLATATNSFTLGQQHEIATQAALAHFQSRSEYRLTGTERVYLRSGELISVGRRSESVRMSSGSYHLLERVAANVQASSPLSTRYSNELLYADSELLVVSRQTSQKLRLSENELATFSEQEIEDSAVWQVLLDDSAPAPSGQILVCGQSKELSLVTLLQKDPWKVIEHELGVYRCSIELSNGQGKCSLDLDSHNDYRPIRIEQSLGPGDLYSGKVLPTDDVQSRKVIYTAEWNHDEMIRLFWETQVTYSSGEVLGRRGEFTVEDFHFGPGTARLELVSIIPSGTQVTMMGAPQIRAEWRDGEIVRVYASGEIASLKSLKMASSGSAWLVWSTMIVVGLGVISFYLVKFYRVKKGQK